MVQRTIESEVERIRNGEVKIASARIDIPDSGEETFIVDVPEDKVAALISTQRANESTVLVDRYEDVTIDTSGTEFHVRNKKSGQSSTSNVTFEYGGTYTLSNKNGEGILPAGIGQQSTGIIGPSERSIVDAGDTVAVVLDNTSTQINTVGIEVEFIERNDT